MSDKQKKQLTIINEGAARWSLILLFVRLRPKGVHRVTGGNVTVFGSGAARKPYNIKGLAVARRGRVKLPTLNNQPLTLGDNYMKNNLKTHRFTIRLSEDELQTLCRIAHREGFYPSAIVRHLIIRFLENRQALGGINGQAIA